MTAFVPAASFVSASFAFGGIAVGWGYFAALRRSVEMHSSGRCRLAAILTAARLVGAVAFLVFAVQFGALPLLAGFLGFLAARSLALRSARGAA
jgi:hypothetical protein